MIFLLVSVVSQTAIYILSSQLAETSMSPPKSYQVSVMCIVCSGEVSLVSIHSGYRYTQAPGSLASYHILTKFREYQISRFRKYRKLY